MLDIVASHTAGDPMSTRKWLNVRLRDIQAKLVEAGHAVSLPVISRLLRGQASRQSRHMVHSAGSLL